MSAYHRRRLKRIATMARTFRRLRWRDGQKTWSQANAKAHEIARKGDDFMSRYGRYL